MTDLRQRAERIAKKHGNGGLARIRVIPLMLEMAAEVRREAIEECANEAEEGRFYDGTEGNIAMLIAEDIRALLPAEKEPVK